MRQVLRKSKTVALVVGLGLLLAACAHTSVRHLNRNVMVYEQVQELQTDYWKFVYTAREMDERLEISGVAYPRETVPVWAGWIEDLWMEAYLSDAKGHVLARHLRITTSKRLDRNEGLPFSFTLTPETLGSPGPVYVTFGYRMVLTAGEKAGEDVQTQEQSKQVFFASEGALTRY